ncbi:MAG: redoxin family protein [Acidiferrobacteraceae bacterium]
MDEWKKDQEADNVTLIPDGNGEFTEGMNMLVDKSDLGFGKRSWRYSMLVKDGVVEKQFIEPDKPGDPFEVSDADTMIEYINPKARIPESVSIITKPGCPYCARAKKMLEEHGMAYGWDDCHWPGPAKIIYTGQVPAGLVAAPRHSACTA